MQVKQLIKQGLNNLFGSSPVLYSGFSNISNTIFSWSTGRNQFISDYRNKIVYAVVNVKLRKLTEAPILVYRIKNEKGYKQYQRELSRKDALSNENLRLMQVKAEMVEVENHEISILLSNPNGYQTGKEFWTAFWGYYELLGETFIFAETPGNDSRNAGKPISLHILPAHMISPVFSGNYYDPIKEYIFDIGDGTKIALPKESVCHFKKWNPDYSHTGGHLGGFSPMNAAAQSIAKNNANSEAQGALYLNGGRGTIISSDMAKDGEIHKYKLSKEQVEDMKKKIQHEWAGVKNYGKFHVTNGYVDVKTIGDTVADQQLIEAGKEDRVEICADFGVDPILIGDQASSSYNNKEQAYKSLVTNVVLTEVQARDEKLMQWLLPKYKNENIKINTDTTVYSELAPDVKLMYETYGKMWELTPNQRIQLFNFEANPDPNMDRIYIPSGFTPLEDAGLNATNPNEIDNANKSYDDYR